MKKPHPRTQTGLTILDVMNDPEVFRPWFHGATWFAWRVFLKALFGLLLTDKERATYQTHTGRKSAPMKQSDEGWLVVGRRGGKSLISALVAVFLACFKDYTHVLAPGERGTVMVIAADRQQARVVFRYIAGLLEGVPMLARMLERKTKESITLSNRVIIEVHTASFRTIRGYTVVAAILDEIAFWPTDDAANPDAEIIHALKPAMATIPGALLLSISSPYARRGELWRAHRQHFGKEQDPVLVWQADTLAMNPAVPNEIIEKAYADDEASASAEYGAQFRRDIETFIVREAVEACIIPGRRELLRIANVRYFGFVDPSGGSQDSMTLAIGHAKNGQAILDVIREVTPPLSPEATVVEFATLLASYGIKTIQGDRYAGEWPREQFRKHGIHYETCEKTKSDLYREILPALNSQSLSLLDHPRLLSQLCGLERRTARGGKDSIDHGPNGHDDVANAVAGVLVMALNSTQGLTRIWFPDLAPDPTAKPLSSDDRQIQVAYPSFFRNPAGELTCADCRHFQDAAGSCAERRMTTQGTMPACEWYGSRPSAK